MIACFVCGGVVELYLLAAVVSAVVAIVHRRCGCKCCSRTDDRE
jgi:hypothetical protein